MEGAVTVPYPASPGAVCANANVLVRVRAVASAMVESFMVFSFSYCPKDKRPPHPRQYNLGYARPPELFTSHRASMFHRGLPDCWNSRFGESPILPERRFRG